jgi:uncharacterized protein YodC (DUF2158 family)
MNFKVGDKIIMIEDGLRMPKGTVGTVMTGPDWDGVVQIKWTDGHGNTDIAGWFTSRLRHFCKLGTI